MELIIPLFIIPVLIIALFIAWLFAEFRAGRLARISLGILSIIGAVAISHSTIPGFERAYHRESLRELGQLAAHGDFQRVQQALSIYNDTAGTDGSTYTAAKKMYHVVSPKPKHRENP
jgi:hypothetical protein